MSNELENISSSALMSSTGLKLIAHAGSSRRSGEIMIARALQFDY